MAEEPPVLERTVSCADLDALYVQHNFDELLKTCQQTIVADTYYAGGHPSNATTIHKHGKKYRLNGVTVAVVFYYTQANKTTRHIRMLRVAGTRYSAPVLPPVHPIKR